MKNVNWKLSNRLSMVALVSLIFMAAMAVMAVPTVKAVPPSVVCDLYVDPSFQKVVVGDDFIVKVNLNTPVNCTQICFNLTFDPNLMTIVDVNLSDFPPIPMMRVETHSPGLITLNVTKLVGGFNGSGTLIEIIFHCNGEGTGFLNFTWASIVWGISPVGGIFHVHNGTVMQYIPPVGGEVLTINGLALLVPWIAITITVALAVATLMVLAGRRIFSR